MNILVTGAAGFLGSCVLRRLAITDYETHGLVRPTTDRYRVLRGFDSIHWLEADIRDLKAVRKAFRASRPSVVIHLATYGAYSYQNDRVRMFETNVLGTLNLLTAAEEAGTFLFLNTGSSSEYGPKTQPMSETDALAPDRPYGVSKAAQTLLASQRSMEKRMAIVTCRLFSVYGPWDNPSKLIPRLLSHSSQGKHLELSSRNVVRDLIFVEDVVDILLRFETISQHSGQVFNIGTGQQTSFEQLVNYASEIFGTTVSVKWNESLLRQWDATSWCADMTKTTSSLAWKPRYSVCDGLNATAQWMRDGNNAQQWI